MLLHFRSVQGELPRDRGDARGRINSFLFTIFTFAFTSAFVFTAKLNFRPTSENLISLMVNYASDRVNAGD
jgi:hypothetical protein